jgi:hypothetical protein
MIVDDRMNTPLLPIFGRAIVIRHQDDNARTLFSRCCSLRAFFDGLTPCSSAKCKELHPTNVVGSSEIDAVLIESISSPCAILQRADGRPWLS